jgi:putative ABC transport system permease protein
MGLSFDANHRQICADFFEAMGIPLKQGRYFDEGDTLQTVPVAIINETMARAYWPNESPLGKRFSIDSTHWITIVGVVADIRQVGLDVPAKAEMYFPYRQSTAQPWLAPTQMVVRASVDPMSLVEAIRRDIQTVDPDQPVSNVQTMGQLLDQETSSRRLGMVLLTAFAGMALLLASLGIYGVLSHFVVQHTPEIGVRLALGAQQRDILALILRKGMILALSGTAIGLAISFALTRLMSSLLYDVSPTDIRTFGITAFLLTTISLLACYIPARKAARVDPMIALRYE